MFTIPWQACWHSLVLGLVVELGSSAAVIVYCREALRRSAGALRRAWQSGNWSETEARLGLAMALGTLRGLRTIGIVSIAMALLLGLRRESAAPVAFLLGIPAVLLAGLAMVGDALQQSASTGVLPLLVGIAPLRSVPG